MTDPTLSLDSQLSAKIEELTGNAGFCEFKIIPADQVVYDKNVYTLLEMECTRYEPKSWSVPPLTGTYEECVRKLEPYDHALLLTTIYPTPDNTDIAAWMTAGQELNRMTIDLTRELRNVEMGLDVLPLGMRCRMCEECAAPLPCRNPDTMLPATESYGVHIMNTMDKHGITGYYDGQTIVCFGILFFRVTAASRNQ